MSGKNLLSSGKKEMVDRSEIRLRNRNYEHVIYYRCRTRRKNNAVNNGAQYSK